MSLGAVSSKGGGHHRLSGREILLQPAGQPLHSLLLPYPPERYNQRLQGLPQDVIDGVQPLIAPHFNLTVEIPLKAIVRGFTWTTVPITWRNRRTGVAKLKIKEMGSPPPPLAISLSSCMSGWKNISAAGIIKDPHDPRKKDEGETAV